MTDPRIDTSVPHSARIWNYWLGGKDNYPVDQAAGEDYRARWPDVVALARAARSALVRGVSHLAGEAGVRQFLDVGTGLPTEDNTHEIAQRVAPEARVVYVDHDPVVLTHARALLTSTPQGATAYVDADMHDTATVLAQAGETLDLDRPVAVILSGVLGHVPDDARAEELVTALTDPLVAGSHLLILDGMASGNSSASVAQDAYNESGAVPYTLRDARRVERLFAGLPLIAPGLVPMEQWRPGVERVESGSGTGYAGLARKP